MSFGNNPNYYGGPPQNYPPHQQGGYGPPPGQFQQGGYNQGPPPGQFQQGGYNQGPPPQQQGGYPPPPQGGFPSPVQQRYGGPPQNQHPPPMQGSYNAPPAFPSPGYDPHVVAQGDAHADADALRGAMKGFGTNEAVLIRILSKPDPLQMALIRKTYTQHIRRDLEKDVASETSSHFKEGLVALVRGPLMQDVHNVHHAIHGVGTNEAVLNDVLLGRSNADMRAIKQAYHQHYGKSLDAAVKDDLSMKTERLFGIVMSANRAEESTPIIPQEIDRDVGDLHRATDAHIGTDEMTVCSILALRSDAQIRVIAQQFELRYQLSLPAVIHKEFSGHMKHALLLLTERALDRTMTDAVQLEDTMKGVGTKDNLLVNRIVRIHWDRDHTEQVKRAYKFKYHQELITRVEREVSGELESLLVACLS